MRDIFETKRLYRDALNTKISGVCAGVARYFSVDPWIIRVAAIVCLFMLPMVTAVAYLMAVLLLRSK